MEFARCIPELTVTDIQKTKAFYMEVLGFSLEYERPEDNFLFLSFEGAQFMFEQFHEKGWNTAPLEYPFGRGVNFSIETNRIEALYETLMNMRYPLYRPLRTASYQTPHGYAVQKEFLLLDPDGYLLRFTKECPSCAFCSNVT